MQVDVAIVGGGIAGTSAAWAARRKLGTDATIAQVFVHDGASGLYSGVLDAPPELWARLGPKVSGAPELVKLLGLRTGGQRDSVLHAVSTRAGVVRKVQISDRALLKLDRFEQCVIGVPDFQRPGWDAAWLARALSETHWATVRRVAFEPKLVALDESFWRYATDFDLAGMLEQPSLQQQLLTALKQHSEPVAWLLGPWLGARAEQASELGERLGLPLGEVTSGPGDAAGARFAAARDRLMQQLGIRHVQGVAVKLREAGDEARNLVVSVDTSAGEPVQIFARSVVVAMGGLVGGGLLLDRERARLGLSMAAPFQPSFGGEDTTEPGSLYGADFAELGARALLRAGVPDRQCRDPRILLAGDVRANSAGALQAIADGLAVAEHLDISSSG